MRIISGKLKGRRIIAPKKLPVRPTTDRAKEALFNILNHRLNWNSIRSLDLFAGTGNISFELASRGVEQLTAVDQNKHCVYFISKTANELDLPIHVIKNSVERFLSRPLENYDLIFADPPYAFTQKQLLDLVEQTLHNGWLKEEGIFVIEHNKHLALDMHPSFFEDRNYGSSHFSFFQHTQDKKSRS